MHKWLAIATDAKNSSDGLAAKIRSFPSVRGHLERSLELNPDDAAVLHLLGKWCYDMSRLSGFRRFVVTALYDSPPECDLEEARDYLTRAVELQSTCYYIPTLYVLGRTCMRLRQYLRARHYLYLASCMPARTDYERFCVRKSKALVAQLDRYDLGEECLLCESEKL